MKLDKFIDKLISVGFIQTDAGENFYEGYENYVDGKGVFVSITAKESDAQGCFPIVINIYDDRTEEETEKDYMTTAGAWNAIKKLF